MSETPPAPQITKWPFLLADLLFVGVAGVVLLKTTGPFGIWHFAACFISAVAGAWVSLIPYMAEYRAAVKLAEASHLADTVGQVKGLQEVGRQVASASAQLQSALDQSARTVTKADEIAGRMTEEVKNFTNFMQQANDREKTHLKLELEKVRRTEADWLQVATMLLDQTFQLHKAAIQSGQQNVAEQIGRFQAVCHDVTRRIGLVPFAPKPGETFDPKSHQPVEQEAVAADARILEILAPGYKYQGQVVRLTPVRVTAPPAGSPPPAETPSEPPTETSTGSSQ